MFFSLFENVYTYLYLQGHKALYIVLFLLYTRNNIIRERGRGGGEGESFYLAICGSFNFILNIKLNHCFEIQQKLTLHFYGLFIFILRLNFLCYRKRRSLKIVISRTVVKQTLIADRFSLRINLLENSASTQAVH